VHAVTRAQRFDIQKVERYRERGKSERHEGKLVNVSRSGMSFQAERLMKARTHVEVAFVLPV
jgi:hypothetical protein